MQNYFIDYFLVLGISIKIFFISIFPTLLFIFWSTFVYNVCLRIRWYRKHFLYLHKNVVLFANKFLKLYNNDSLEFAVAFVYFILLLLEILLYVTLIPVFYFVYAYGSDYYIILPSTLLNQRDFEKYKNKSADFDLETFLKNYHPGVIFEIDEYPLKDMFTDIKNYAAARTNSHKKYQNDEGSDIERKWYTENLYRDPHNNASKTNYFLRNLWRNSHISSNSPEQTPWFYPYWNYWRGPFEQRMIDYYLNNNNKLDDYTDIELARWRFALRHLANKRSVSDVFDSFAEIFERKEKYPYTLFDSYSWRDSYESRKEESKKYRQIVKEEYYLWQRRYLQDNAWKHRNSERLKWFFLNRKIKRLDLDFIMYQTPDYFLTPRKKEQNFIDYINEKKEIVQNSFFPSEQESNVNNIIQENDSDDSSVKNKPTSTPISSFNSFPIPHETTDREFEFVDPDSYSDGRDTVKDFAERLKKTDPDYLERIMKGPKPDEILRDQMKRKIEKSKEDVYGGKNDPDFKINWPVFNSWTYPNDLRSTLYASKYVALQDNRRINTFNTIENSEKTAGRPFTWKRYFENQVVKWNVSLPYWYRYYFISNRFPRRRKEYEVGIRNELSKYFSSLIPHYWSESLFWNPTLSPDLFGLSKLNRYKYNSKNYWHNYSWYGYGATDVNRRPRSRGLFKERMLAPAESYFAFMDDPYRLKKMRFSRLAWQTHAASPDVPHPHYGYYYGYEKFSNVIPFNFFMPKSVFLNALFSNEPYLGKHKGEIFSLLNPAAFWYGYKAQLYNLINPLNSGPSSTHMKRLEADQELPFEKTGFYQDKIDRGLPVGRRDTFLRSFWGFTVGMTRTVPESYELNKTPFLSYRPHSLEHAFDVDYRPPWMSVLRRWFNDSNPMKGPEQPIWGMHPDIKARGSLSDFDSSVALQTLTHYMISARRPYYLDRGMFQYWDRYQYLRWKKYYYLYYKFFLSNYYSEETLIPDYLDFYWDLDKLFVHNSSNLEINDKLVSESSHLNDYHRDTLSKEDGGTGHRGDYDTLGPFHTWPVTLVSGKKGNDSRWPVVDNTRLAIDTPFFRKFIEEDLSIRSVASPVHMQSLIQKVNDPKNLYFIRTRNPKYVSNYNRLYKYNLDPWPYNSLDFRLGSLTHRSLLELFGSQLQPIVKEKLSFFRRLLIAVPLYKRYVKGKIFSTSPNLNLNTSTTPFHDYFYLVYQNYRPKFRKFNYSTWYYRENPDMFLDRSGFLRDAGLWTTTVQRRNPLSFGYYKNMNSASWRQSDIFYDYDTPISLFEFDSSLYWNRPNVEDIENEINEEYSPRFYHPAMSEHVYSNRNRFRKKVQTASNRFGINPDLNETRFRGSLVPVFGFKGLKLKEDFITDKKFKNNDFHNNAVFAAFTEFPPNERPPLEFRSFVVKPSVSSKSTPRHFSKRGHSYYAINQISKFLPGRYFQSSLPISLPSSSKLGIDGFYFDLPLHFNYPFLLPYDSPLKRFVNLGFSFPVNSYFKSSSDSQPPQGLRIKYPIWNLGFPEADRLVSYNQRLLSNYLNNMAKASYEFNRSLDKLFTHTYYRTHIDSRSLPTKHPYGKLIMPRVYQFCSDYYRMKNLMDFLNHKDFIVKNGRVQRHSLVSDPQLEEILYRSRLVLNYFLNNSFYSRFSFYFFPIFHYLRVFIYDFGYDSYQFLLGWVKLLDSFLPRFVSSIFSSFVFLIFLFVSVFFKHFWFILVVYLVFRYYKKCYIRKYGVWDNILFQIYRLLRSFIK